MLFDPAERSMLLSPEEKKHASSDPELESWVPSFAAQFGMDAEAIVALRDTQSTLIDKVLRTYDDIYAHCTAKALIYEMDPVAMDAAEELAKRTDIDPVWTEQHAANASAAQQAQQDSVAQDPQAQPLPLTDVDITRTAWKDAVEQRRIAVDDWNRYVRHKHELFIQAKKIAKIK